MSRGKTVIIRFISCVLIIMGLAFFAAPFFSDILPQFRRDLVETTATIDSVVFVGYDSDGDRTYHTVIRYPAEGKLYVEEVGFYNSSKHPGDQLRIFYDSADPEFVIVRTPGMTTAFMLLGGLMLAGGIAAPFGFRALEKKKAYIRENGRRVIAEVEQVGLREDIEINGRNPYRVVCSFTDPFTGENTKYYSDNLWDDRNLRPGDSVCVYVDRDDPTRYIVDI